MPKTFRLQAHDGTDWVNVRADEISAALVMVGFKDHMIHAGCHYFIKTWLDVDGADTVTRFIFRTPDTTTRIHARAHIAAESEFTIEIWENVAVSADGAPIAAWNNDRDSERAAELQAFSSPTITDEGDLMWPAKVGSGKDATVSSGMGYEIVARRNTIYMFKITKIAASVHWLDVNFWWSEHVPVEN